MPPPMHALNSYKPPPPVVTDQPRQMKDGHYSKPVYNGFPGARGVGGAPAGGIPPRDQRKQGPPPTGMLNGGDAKLFSPGYNVDSYNQGKYFTSSEYIKSGLENEN